VTDFNENKKITLISSSISEKYYQSKVLPLLSCSFYKYSRFLLKNTFNFYKKAILTRSILNSLSIY